jgi:HD superfamily phosphohydrolase
MDLHCEQYGSIHVDVLAKQIIETPVFQRLHLIRQTGLVFMVFPSATHTRFAHSLGVYHLARQCVEHLYAQHGGSIVTEDHRRLIPIAGLCHDLGHGPFSHVFEKVVQSHQDWHHEQQSIRLLYRLVSHHSVDLSPGDLIFLKACIHPSEEESRLWTYQIVANLHNGIDVDKLDYLNRDAVSFGIPPPLRIQRILGGMRIQDNEIRFLAGIQNDLLDVFYHRFRMFRYFYQHSTVVALDTHVGTLMKDMDFNPYLEDEDSFVHKLTDAYIIGTIDWQSVQKKIFCPQRQDEVRSISLNASIVGYTYLPNPLAQVHLTDHTSLLESGAHATMVAGLSEVWEVVMQSL